LNGRSFYHLVNGGSSAPPVEFLGFALDVAA